MSELRVESIELRAAPVAHNSELFINGQKVINARACTVQSVVGDATRVTIEFVRVKNVDVFLPLEGKFKLVPIEDDER